MRPDGGFAQPFQMPLAFGGQDKDFAAAIGVDPNGKAAIDWGVYGIPESYLVGADGTILYKKVGPFDPETFQTQLMPAIEKALAHKDPDAIRAIYNRGTYWNERVQMMQWWSDYLDTLKTGAVVLPFAASAVPSSPKFK